MSEKAIYKERGSGYSLTRIEVDPSSSWNERPPLAIAVGTSSYWENSEYQYGYISKQADGTYLQKFFNASGDYVRGGLSASLNPYYVGAEYHFNYDMNQNGSIDDRHNISVESASIAEGETKEIKILEPQESL